MFEFDPYFAVFVCVCVWVGVCVYVIPDQVCLYEQNDLSSREHTQLLSGSSPHTYKHTYMCTYTVHTHNPTNSCTWGKNSFVWAGLCASDAPATCGVLK